MSRLRRLGAELMKGEGVSFRVFAPEHPGVEVVVEEGDTQTRTALGHDAEVGYWTGSVPHLGAGARYRFCLAGDSALYPDPASRFQPEGPFGPSEVIDPSFAWTDSEFEGAARAGNVIYELHVGTFTPQGSWAAAMEKLTHLASLGITLIELLPVAEFAGARGWGYDGVNLFAPHRHYGRPDELRRFVDAAHGLGIGVILDVVYNHFGPDGNFICKFAGSYVSDVVTEWGTGLNYDGPGPRPMRELVRENVAHWIGEYHLDGLRVDATQAIFDTSPRHILEELVSEARRVAGKRHVVVIGENEPQDARMLRPSAEGGFGFDALWNDDFHHSVVAALTGHRDAYYSDYEGSARELLAAVKHGFLFQGQTYHWQHKRRGHATRGLPPRAFVAFLENHDQTANYGLGQRLWARSAPGCYRAVTALLLLGPWTPMLFQGQEWQSSSPFTYFADHGPELAAQVKRGRADFLSQFPRYATVIEEHHLPDPGTRAGFERCRLDWGEVDRPLHARALRLHRDLLALRKTDPTLARQGDAGVTIDGAVFGRHRLLIRFFGVAPDGTEDRLLLLNLGADHDAVSLSEPLSAPPAGYRWAVRWSSEDSHYGGQGVRGPKPDHDIFFAGQAAELFVPEPEPEPDGRRSDEP
ncbi:MAG TPA: malto-oligosyltrehalose trehalohydrolase [Polyangia bacterium]|jgi:maltooligosyltrehalose trehalohydrolase